MRFAARPITRFTEARCVVCGGTSDDVVLRDNGYEGRACACGTIYTAPTPPKGAVDPTYVLHPEGFYDLPAGLKARWVRRHAGGVSLLEVGCGSGAFLTAAQQVGFDVEGLEPVPARAALAEQRTGAVVHRSYLEDFVPGARQYDVVYHCDMLAHFADPRSALFRMISLLAPGGVLAFEVGLIGGIPRFWYRGMRHIGYPQHLWLYSEASLRLLLQQSGLRIRSATRFDLSGCFAMHQLVRTVAALLGHGRCRAATPGVELSATPPTAAPTQRVPLHLRSGYVKLENFLRYRVGALLPRLGEGTLLVVAERH